MAAGVVRALARIDRCRPAADGGLGDVLEPVVRPPELLLESVARQHPEERSDDLARKLAMHIAAMKPSWIGRDDVPEDTVAQEREIYASTDEVQSKPEQAREKIVEGMLNKRFFGANVLLEQDWIHDSGKTVGDALGEEGAEVLEFERFELSAG